MPFYFIIQPLLLLQYLTDNLGGLLVRLEQLLALLALSLDCVILVQQLLEEIFLVQRRHQTVLYNILGVVDQQMHDRLGHLVSNSLSHNVEVR